MNCPLCDDEVKDLRAGCPECEIFQCAACKKWVGWDRGADDDDENRPLCNDCWSDEADDVLDKLDDLEAWTGDDDDEPEGGGSIRA